MAIRRIRAAVVLSIILLAASPCLARDDVLMLPIADAIAQPDAQNVLGNTVKFYFGTRPAGQVLQAFGTIVANPKTNGFARSHGRACERAFLSALVALQSRALALGANAVVNIESFYRKHDVSSETQFECHKGFLIAGVALRGEIVRLAEP